jgi:hypothetical protein
MYPATKRLPPNPRPDPAHLLATVRAQSCYGGLRSAFNVSLSITFALCALGFVSGIISILNSFSVFHRGAETTFIFGLSVIAGSAVVAFLAFAGRQAAVVMLDIADLLVAQQADSRMGM